MPEHPQVTIVDNPEHHRVEARTDSGQLTGFSQYHVRDGAYVFFHTEVDDKFEGQGVGSQIAAGVVEFVRSRGMPILPECPFVRGYMRKRPETHDCLVSPFNFATYSE
jgi:uncharacterized protein